MTSTDLTRIRLDLGYDGTDFAGWAKQPGLRTVQEVLETAVHQMFGFRGEPILITVAGRTDAGVHAEAQVAHLDLDPERVARLMQARGADGQPEPDIAHALLRRVNGMLGLHSDVWLHSARIVPNGFSARFSALSRSYRYRIADNEALKDPLHRRSTVWLPRTLDRETMDRTAARLVGLHDFAGFCRPRVGATTIRNLTGFSWRRDADGVLIAELRADAFCHSMVRSLVGACIATSTGLLPEAAIEGLLREDRRGQGFATAQAHGLTLTGVEYPEDALLAARAELTRQRRTSTTPFPGEPGWSAEQA
ncbi:tRNA pseudouridine(38-40) synthase TruA [Mycetocola tolaasinivorans]|uniref:tRNA pseudouridine synthase A n=1 Tax=Mycetocola tolaasinivorans TaxID=76635 RepID=A0A3L7AAQ8_9MICO|nr:tRNA pseudouridine synthase A [Mycetocola tolaasinivorans]RLP77556.1 tRNA pseudouridine(38-40) synthase TruA [Mycetocola tolaasinivorans]